MHVVPGARTYPQPDFGADALERVSGWVEQANDMFVDAGLTEAASLSALQASASGYYYDAVDHWLWVRVTAAVSTIAVE